MKKSLEFKVLAVVGALLATGIISAAVMAVIIQRETLFSLAEVGTEKTALVIFQNIETVMLEGKATSVREMVANISRLPGIEEIHIITAEGRDAFKEGSPVREAAAVSELASGREKIMLRQSSRLTCYLPLRNSPSCRACHSNAGPLLGAVKISINIAKEYKRAMSLITMVILITIVASLCFSFVLWKMLRRMVIRPVKSIETAAARVAEGDLSFPAESAGDDEIGRMSVLLKNTFSALEGVLLRIKDLSGRILMVVAEVEKEAEKVRRGAEAEAAATENISSSVEELTATATEIADSTESLASSAGDASASVDQMVTSITHINASIQQLDEIVENNSGSITQLSASIQEVAESSAELAGASEGSASSIAEIAATIGEVEAAARESAALSEKVASDAGTLGMASIAKTMEGMNVIAASVQETAQCIGVLGNRSKEIEKILSVIKSVNDETDLLALNATILASKAGDHGKGFSVVATEMKELAERTDQSTTEIAALIAAVQQEVHNAGVSMQKGIAAVSSGLKLVKDAEEALTKVLESSRRSSEMSAAIKRSTGEQTQAAGQVRKATELVRMMVDKIARATAEQSKSVGLVAEAAEKMKQLSHTVSTATREQATSSSQIAQITELVSERSLQISRSLIEHKRGSGSILSTIETVKDIPLENRKLASRIGATLYNLQKDAELLKAEMERFKFSATRDDSLRLGVVPLQEPSAMFRKFSPLAAYLTRKTGKKVDLRVAIDMESAVKDIGEDVTQLCAMGPANYIDAHMRYGVKVIVKALRHGKPFHRAAIVVRADGGIHSLSGLKGRKLALGSPKSATGHIMPLVTLKIAGVTARDLGEYRFLGRHDKLAKAVLSGEFDAAGVPEETALAYRDKGLVVLQASPEIPEFNICCNSSVGEETMKVIAAALTSLDISKKEDAEVLKSLGKDCTGFVPAGETDYRIFRENIRSVEAEVDADIQMHGAR